jgi:CelD/BcsL family acetyltransferase involved in cellulose biosynthesis
MTQAPDQRPDQIRGDAADAVPTEPPVAIEETPDLQALVALKQPWELLLADYPGATMFLSHGFVCAWWRAFGRGKRLRILVFRSAGRIIGIAPLMQRLQWQLGAPTRCISPLRNKQILREDLILPERPQACLDAMFGYFAARRRQWDRLSFSNVPEHSPLFRLLGDAARSRGLDASAWRPGRTHWVLPFQGDFPDYLDTLSKKFRQELRRHQTRLDKLGPSDHRDLQDRADQLAALDDVFALERRSWKAQTRNAALGAADRDFIRELLLSLDESQLGRTMLTTQGDWLIAACLTFAQGDTLYGLTTYYDVDASSMGPGALMTQELLRRIWGGPWHRFDFNGDTPFIRRWGGHGVAHYSTDLFSDSVYARLLQAGWRWRSSHQKQKHS